MANKLELTWYGKDEPIRIEPRLLIENAALSNTAADPAAENMIIHGDNLLALKALETQFVGQVKCVYIDPPYNIGAMNEYYDDLIEHSLWLNRMRPRIEILRNLLCEEGVIFIQISDEEQAYLKILCDEIFGRANFVNMVSVNMKNIAGASGGGEDKRLKKNCEYILIYAKRYDFLPLFNGPYVDASGKTVASADLRAAERLKGKNQPQSIYPAHAALGLSVSDTLLINCNPILVEGESDQLYLSALKNLLISKGKISPLKEIVFIPTGGVKGIKATSAILSGVNEVKPPVLIDGDKPGVKMFNELKADFYAADTDKLIMVTGFSAIPEAEVEDLLPKAKFATIIARFLPRPEDTDEEFDDVVVDNRPVCNQIEEFAKAQGIDLGKGWKVRLAAMVKREILKGTDKVICETDPEFAKILELFNQFS